MSKIFATRYHDFSYGHRVVGHEGKCRFLHGHNGRVHFKVSADTGLDNVGRVLDFSVIKSKLCMWLEDNWDHKFLMWESDAVLDHIFNGTDVYPEEAEWLGESIVQVPFNPTAENMAQYLVEVIGPQQLKGTGCTLQSVTIEETRKCSAAFIKGE